MRHAFTLLEVVVVISIIALLSALLFPVFSRVREKSRSSTCESNLRQIQLAVQMYSADNSHYPLWFNEYGISTPLPNSKPGKGWAVRIMPYVKNNSIFQCPSESIPSSDDPNASVVVGSPAFTDYGYNLNLTGVPESMLVTPSITISFVDDIPSPAWGYAHLLEENDSLSGTRHYQGINCAFVDGHVKWFRPTSIAYSSNSNSQAGCVIVGVYEATMCAF